MSTILYHLPAKRNLLYSLSRISSYIYLVGRIFGVSSFHLPLIPVHIPEVAALTEIYDDTDDTGEFEDIAETDQIDEDQLAVPDTRGFSSGTLSLIKQYAAFSETLKANSAVGMVEPVVRKRSQSPDQIPLQKVGPHSDIVSNVPVLLSGIPKGSPDSNPCSIMPAFNEEKQIATDHCPKAQNYVDKVIVVDDGSTDATVADCRGPRCIRRKTYAEQGIRRCTSQTICITATSIRCRCPRHP